MIELDATDAECTVYTFKEGLLSPLAHDLKIRVTRFTLAISDDHGEVRAVFDPTSLRTVGATKGGREAPEALSATDRETIDGNVDRAVLHGDRWPEIRFVSERVTPAESGFTVVGALTLHGRTALLEVPVRRRGAHLLAEVRLDQTRFGVRPYTGLMGTLRIKPEIVVEVRVPAAALGLG